MTLLHRQIPNISSTDIFQLNDKYQVSLETWNDQNIVIVDNVYKNPLSIKNFILTTPCFLDNQSAYPGFRSRSVIQTDLTILCKKLIALYYPNFIDRLHFNNEFIGGIISPDSLIGDQVYNIHHDGNGLAGIVYFNDHDSGGTQFFEAETNHNPILQIPMRFNRLLLYPMYIFHSGWFVPNSFTTEYRITQNIFYDRMEENGL